MAEENIHRQELSIWDLTTRSVTLYPSRAHVIRDINDINDINDITLQVSLSTGYPKMKLPNFCRLYVPPAALLTGFIPARRK